jgi:hypothetical protein
MPTLNEYLGGIFSSITDARVVSDVQAVHIAEQYAKHELLKHFAVPRMRIGDIELTIPVAIDSLAARTELQLEPIGNSSFRSLIYRELVAGTGLIAFPLNASQALSTRVEANARTLAENLQRSSRDESFSIFSKQTVSDLARIVAEYGIADSTVIDKINYDTIHARIHKISQEVVTGVVEKRNFDQLEVVAESYRLREQRPEDLIYIRMKVNEDSMEWQTIQRDDGSVERKLLPE